MIDVKLIEKNVLETNKLISEIREELGKKIVGQHSMIESLLIGLFSSGHLLLEGVPGIAKTLAIKTLAQVIDLDYKRIQFTPDLLPADLVGSMTYRPQTGDFVARKGPVFANIILADEINRAPAKVQSALLEAMQEGQVTIGDVSYQLPKPFFVLATQNPIEQEGTYPLPEAQLDRFAMKVKVDYPSADEEYEILKLMGVEHEIKTSKLLDAQKIEAIKKVADSILVDERIEKYIVSIVAASRATDRFSLNYVKYIEYGASPRATLCLYRCAKVRALLEGRCFVVPDDVKTVAKNVLRHRIVLSYEAESEELSPEDVIEQILKVVQVP
ncbi:MAG: AAA family ATPase [Spirochaetales bacterium]|nr:AAA family ATPase [Spirochaetales bacterium]